MGARLKSPADKCTNVYRHTWASFIQPYLEGTAIANAMNFSLPYNWYVNTTAVYAKTSTYICPTDTPKDELPSNWAQPAQASYAAVRGITEGIYYYSSTLNPDRCNVIDGEGLLGSNNVYLLRDCTDGLSNTAVVGETSRFRDEVPGSQFNFATVLGSWTGPYWPAGTPTWPGDVRITGRAYVVPRLNSAAVKNASTACLTASGVGPYKWYLPTNAPVCADLGQFGFRSNHPGGGNFLFGDGSVRFVKQTIGFPAYQAIGTRAGGEVIGADQL